MNSADIRSKFIQFFSGHGHHRVNSSSLVPHDDQSLLFTNAGMVQFKRLFTGDEKRDYTRAVTSQKCVRAGGKHNDLENVGYTARHHTFFEMLGNFSFGDYFKSEAINFAWDLLVRGFKLPADRLFATIYNEDDEAFLLWQKITGLPEDRIVRLGEKDNFWAMGDTGPCGPCSEILIDQGPEAGCGRPDCAPGCDCDRYLEIWNLVFMQFERQGGVLKPLPRPSIDTGMGLERLAAVIQKVPTNFETDLFTPLLDQISRLSGTPYIYGQRLHENDPGFQTNVSLRVIADHARAVTFLVADGVRPENLGRGYVLRRILRRAVRHGRKLGLDRPFMGEMVDTVINTLKQTYPEIADSASYVRGLVSAEEVRFGETLGSGLSILNEAIGELLAKGGRILDGRLAFKLYDTFGFPVDLVADVAREHGLAVDESGFDLAMNEQKAKGRAAWKSGSNEDQTFLLVNRLTMEGFKSEFTGYDSLEETAILPALMAKEGQEVREAKEGDNLVLVFPKTPFYATSGGQEGDQGKIVFPEAEFRVNEVIKAPGSGVFLHLGQVIDGRLLFGQKADLYPDVAKRQATANNHSSTHLLHRALRLTLGDHVRQAGSLVNFERLRFDFTHSGALTSDEIEEIERRVNADICMDYQVETSVMDMEEAVRSGAVALFEERYGEKVRVVSMGESRELCGGTHTDRTGRIGFLTILGESSVSAGVRRLECVTGAAALGEFQKQRRLQAELSGLLKSRPEELADRLKKQLLKLKELEKGLKTQISVMDPEVLSLKVREKDSLKCLAVEVSAGDPKSLRELGDLVKQRLGPRAVMALAAKSADNKALVLVTVGSEIVETFKAGTLVAKMAEKVGGKGGGRPDMAQAGGPLVEGIPEALALIYELVLGEK